MKIYVANFPIIMALLVSCTTAPNISSAQSPDITKSLQQNRSNKPQIRSDGNCISTLGLGFILNGGTITGYATSMSMPGTPCLISTVTCVNGSLNGPDLYPSCSDINQNCQGVPNGGSVSGYASPIAPCLMTTVTCTNGTLSGPMPFPACM